MVTKVPSPVALNGPHTLNAATIDKVVTFKSPGVYVLAVTGSNEARRTGRSDVDLAGRLKQYVGTTYAKFWFAYASSPKDAFEKECRLWHHYKPSGAPNHPDRPNGTGWKCPICKVFG